MAVSESLSAYSTTAASNTPAGTDAVGTELDDHLRDIKRLVRTVGQSSRGIASPDIVPGRLWYDSSGSASAFAVLKIGDGAQDIALFEINESANTTLPYFGSTVAGSAGASLAQQPTKASAVSVIDAVDEAYNLSAGPGLSGAGTFSANRAISLGLGTLQTLTASATAAMQLAIADGSAERAVTMKNLIGAVVAAQANMETAVSSDVVATPLVQQYHPGHPKAHGYIRNDGTSATILASYGISTALRSAGGIVKLTWTTKFSTADYTCLAIGVGARACHIDTSVTVLSASLKIRTVLMGSNTSTDGDFMVIALGDQ